MKIRLLTLLFISAIFFFPVSVRAQQDSSVFQSQPADAVARPIRTLPIPESGASLPFGQNHFYTVTLRGNGEALVFLKTVFSNTTEASISAMKYTFPTAVQNIGVFQAYREPQCMYYDDIYSDPRISMRPPPAPAAKCRQYQEPDYSYGWGNTTYHKASVELNENTLTIELPKQVKPQGNGSLILVYSMPGITSKDLLGAYSYSFDTVKSTDSIQNLQIGIMTDPDYYLKDAKGEINYQTKEMAAMSAPSEMRMDSAGGVGNAQFDQFYNQIGQGTVVKSVTNLQPNESYNIKGVYANNKAKLYGREIGIGAGVVILILVLAGGALYIAVKKIFGNKGEVNTLKSRPIIPVLGASFGSSLFILLYTAGLYFFSIYFAQKFQYYSYNSFYPLLLILLTVISLCVYSLFLFAPGVVVGIKKGILAGIATLVMTVFWLMFFSVIIAGIAFLFFQNNSIAPYPVAYPMGGIEKGVGVFDSSVPTDTAVYQE